MVYEKGWICNSTSQWKGRIMKLKPWVPRNPRNPRLLCPRILRILHRQRWYFKSQSFDEHPVFPRVCALALAREGLDRSISHKTCSSALKPKQESRDGFILSPDAAPNHQRCGHNALQLKTLCIAFFKFSFWPGTLKESLEMSFWIWIYHILLCFITLYHKHHPNLTFFVTPFQPL